MTYSYLYIEDLFRSILTNSKNIAGRFHVSYKYGAQEINSDSLGDLVAEIVTKKYPLCLMTAPTSRLTINADWERYRIQIFFVNKTYVENMNPNTRTSRHTVAEDWQDMKRCARGFISQLESLQKTSRGLIFRLPDKTEMFVHPVSLVGQDRVSGVKLDFDFLLYTGICDPVEDYPILLTEMPIILDSHPEHKL